MSRRKKRGGSNRVVPINKATLQALLEDRGWTVAELARHTGDHEQTLLHLITGPGKGCRAGRRRKIAQALQVPEEQLADEPFLVPLGFAIPSGFEFRYSALTQLAANRVLTAAAKACDRDLALLSEAERTWPPASLVMTSVLTAITELIQIGSWRQRLIAWNAGEQERRGYTEPATSAPWSRKGRVVRVYDPTPRPKGLVAYAWEGQPPVREEDRAHEEAVLGIIRALDHVLTPWFDGTAQLNYRSIRDLTLLPAHPFAHVVERVSPHSPYAILWPSGDGVPTAGASTEPNDKERA